MYDKRGAKVGAVTDVVVDPMTLEAEWYEVKVGLIGGHHLVPALRMVVDGDHCTVPYDKDQIKAAPNAEAPLLDDEKESLRAHYQLTTN